MCEHHLLLMKLHNVIIPSAIEGWEEEMKKWPHTLTF